MTLERGDDGVCSAAFVDRILEAACVAQPHVA